MQGALKNYAVAADSNSEIGKQSSAEYAVLCSNRTKLIFGIM
jgi:hypothetical protein